jgi:ATP-binding cassette subfamily C protein CydC
MPQYIHVFNDTLLENIAFSKNIPEDRLHKAFETACFTDFLADCPDGLLQWLGATGIELSGGEKKRLGLVRALLHDAPILLLDEPTEGLDATMGLKIIDNLLKNYPDKTIILVTHQERITHKMRKYILY